MTGDQKLQSCSVLWCSGLATCLSLGEAWQPCTGGYTLLLHLHYHLHHQRQRQTPVRLYARLLARTCEVTLAKRLQECCERVSRVVEKLPGTFLFALSLLDTYSKQAHCTHSIHTRNLHNTDIWMCFLQKNVKVDKDTDLETRRLHRDDKLYSMCVSNHTNSRIKNLLETATKLGPFLWVESSTAAIG